MLKKSLPSQSKSGLEYTMNEARKNYALVVNANRKKVLEEDLNTVKMQTLNMILEIMNTYQDFNALGMMEH
jgi:hypothetical protein